MIGGCETLARLARIDPGVAVSGEAPQVQAQVGSHADFGRARDW